MKTALPGKRVRAMPFLCNFISKIHALNSKQQKKQAKYFYNDAFYIIFAM